MNGSDDPPDDADSRRIRMDIQAFDTAILTKQAEIAKLTSELAQLASMKGAAAQRLETWRGLGHTAKKPVTCLAVQECKEYLTSLGLEHFFDPAHDKCFAACCYRSQQSSEVTARGNPPKNYVIPRGWTRIGLTVNDGLATFHNVWNTWHVGFHGTTPQVLASVLSIGGDLVSVGDRLMDTMSIRAGTAGSNVSVYASPSIRYAELPMNSKAARPAEGRSVQCILQVRMKPGAYAVQPESVGWRREHADTRIEAMIPNDEIEMECHQRGAVMITSVLMRFRDTSPAGVTGVRYTSERRNSAPVAASHALLSPTPSTGTAPTALSQLRRASDLLRTSTPPAPAPPVRPYSTAPSTPPHLSPVVVAAVSPSPIRLVINDTAAAVDDVLTSRLTRAEDMLLGRGLVQRDIVEAVRELFACAEMQHPRAMVIVGNALYWGAGLLPAITNKDQDLGARLLTSAAQAGELLGKFVCLLYGVGCTKDAKAAGALLHEQGDPADYLVQFWLGDSFYWGNGVPQNRETAVELYRQAADLGYAPACFQLGVCLWNGWGAAQDRTAAKHYWETAAELGHQHAVERLKLVQ